MDSFGGHYSAHHIGGLFLSGRDQRKFMKLEWTLDQGWEKTLWGPLGNLRIEWNLDDTVELMLISSSTGRWLVGECSYFGEMRAEVGFKFHHVCHQCSDGLAEQKCVRVYERGRAKWVQKDSSQSRGLLCGSLSKIWNPLKNLISGKLGLHLHGPFLCPKCPNEKALRWQMLYFAWTYVKPDLIYPQSLGSPPLSSQTLTFSKDDCASAWCSC